MKTRVVYELSKLARQFGLRFNAEKDQNYQEMLREIKELGGLQFMIEHHPDGEWLAKSVNVEGILTGGGKRDNVDETIKDAVFTYYGIKPQYCHEAILRTAGESKITHQAVLAAA